MTGEDLGGGRQADEILEIGGVSRGDCRDGGSNASDQHIHWQDRGRCRWGLWAHVKLRQAGGKLVWSWRLRLLGLSRRLLRGPAAVAASLILALPAIASVEAATCVRAPLLRRPVYTTSAAWSPLGELLVVDSGSSRILRYSNEGRALGELSAGLSKALEDFFPLTVKRRQLDSGKAEVVLELSVGRLLSLGERHSLLEQRPVLEQARRSEQQPAEREPVDRSVESMFMWDFVGDDVFSCGDILVQGAARDDDDWQSGFVRIPLDASRSSSSTRRELRRWCRFSGWSCPTLRRDRSCRFSPSETSFPS